MYHKVFYLKFTLKYNFALLGNVAHQMSLVSHRIIIQKKDQLYKNSLKLIKIQSSLQKFTQVYKNSLKFIKIHSSL